MLTTWKQTAWTKNLTVSCWFLPCDAMHSAAIAVTRCLSVTFVSCAKTNKDIFEIFSPCGSLAILVFPHKRGGAIPTRTPLTGVSHARGYEKIDDFRPISRCISETVIVRWAHAARQFISIKFSFHPYNTLAWLPQGRSQGKQKCSKKIAIFGFAHWLKHRITRKLLNIDRYMLRGVWQALNSLSIHATYCMIIAGASPGETKMWAVVRENCDFLHLRFE